MAGDCGSCTMCCKLLAVTELGKRKNTQCKHCSVGVGCKIYDDRPVSCGGFSCLWLQTQDSGAKALPLSLRPDKSKTVIHTTENNIVAKVDPGFPLAWMDKGMGTLLASLSEMSLVLVDNGKQYWLINDGGIREIRMSVADENAEEHFEGYVS